MNSESAIPSVTGLILAGGRASRMQQQDKGLLQLDGRSLTEHVIARLAPQVANVAINANRNLNDYARFGFPVWQDQCFDPALPDEEQFQGPLAGVETGLIHCTTPYLLTAPCDSPFLPEDLARRLMTSLSEENADIAVACTGDSKNPRLQPVFCLMPVTCLAQVRSYFHEGGRRMDGWYRNFRIARVYFSNDSEFRNINTLNELQDCATEQIAHQTEK